MLKTNADSSLLEASSSRKIHGNWLGIRNVHVNQRQHTTGCSADATISIFTDRVVYHRPSMAIKYVPTSCCVHHLSREKNYSEAPLKEHGTNGDGKIFCHIELHVIIM